MKQERIEINKAIQENKKKKIEFINMWLEKSDFK